MRSATIATAIAALIFGSLAITGSAGAQPPQGEAVGVNFSCIGANSADQTSVFNALGVAKAGWTRIFLPWSAVQPPSPTDPAVPEFPGGYNPTVIAKLHSCVEQAHAAGLHVLVTFLNTPSWAGKAWDAAPPAAAYASALGYLVGQFSQGSSRVEAWEVWNEENTRFFWRGTASQYVQLLQASYRAVKQANPKAMVVFGGTAHNDYGWVRKCYQDGARGYFDVLATHPYPSIRTNTRLGQVIGSVRRVRNVMVANQDAQTPIWFTEYGWSRTYVSARMQARLLYRSLQYMASHLSYVKAAFWFQAKTVGQLNASNWWLGGLALLTPSGAITPAYRALVRYDNGL